MKKITIPVTLKWHQYIDFIYSVAPPDLPENLEDVVTPEQVGKWMVECLIGNGYFDKREKDRPKNYK